MLSPQWRITVPFLVPAIFKTEYAPVMELVDMRDLGSRAAMRVGSSPFRRTKIPKTVYLHGFRDLFIYDNGGVPSVCVGETKEERFRYHNI